MRTVSPRRRIDRPSRPASIRYREEADIGGLTANRFLHSPSRCPREQPGCPRFPHSDERRHPGLHRRAGRPALQRRIWQALTRGRATASDRPDIPIPFYLLRKRFANLSDDDPSLTWMELAETLKRKMLLEDVLRDERFRYELREDEKRTGQEFNRWVRVGEPAPERRSFHFPGNPDMRWYWIDFEQEWP
jgi:hypothetical protein